MESLKGYKGFDMNMKCRDFQYEEGKSYEMEKKPTCCEKGFHFCEYPLDIFDYYNPCESEFHEVEALGDIDKKKDSNDSYVRVLITLNLSRSATIK